MKFLYIISVSQDPPLTRDLSMRQCERLLIGMTPSHNCVAPKIFPGLYSYLGALSRVLGFATLPIRSIPLATVRLSIDYIEVTLVALPRISRGYFAGVILWVSTRLGSNSTVALHVEAEGHNNWLCTSACCVWESQASPK